MLLPEHLQAPLDHGDDGWLGVDQVELVEPPAEEGAVVLGTLSGLSHSSL